MFPDRVNTEFIELVDDKTIKMRVWERGADKLAWVQRYTCKVLVHLI